MMWRRSNFAVGNDGEYVGEYLGIRRDRGAEIDSRVAFSREIGIRSRPRNQAGSRAGFWAQSQGG